jgi:hypothetical protein
MESPVDETLEKAVDEVGRDRDGVSPIPHLTDEELVQLLDEQQKALDRMMGSRAAGQ